MAYQLITAPYVEINNVLFEVYGNSITYDQGLPDIEVSAISAGGGAVKTVHGVNIESAVSMLKFKIPNIKETDDILPEWKANVGTNVVKIYQGLFTKTMLGASFAEGREVSLTSSQGGIEVTFKGDPLS